MIKYKTNVAFKAFAIENIFEDESIFNWFFFQEIGKYKCVKNEEKNYVKKRKERWFFFSPS